ncbi:hypothetical protein LCGC14_1048240 [marine sediment metagenome]|uniref:Uncharacterized protein n=1 Tax=marine sediment metagenome TaxID=412755 RepID=A0A0F9MPP3_9ZZZZ
MATGQVITNKGRLIMMHRAFTASPTITAPTRFKIGTGTTTPAVGDTDMTTPVNINGTEFKNFISGFPTLDTTNMIATVRCLVDTTEANGNSLTEFGIINTDGTPLLLSHAVHTAITKTSSVQTTYIEKDQVI